MSSGTVDDLVTLIPPPWFTFSFEEFPIVKYGLILGHLGLKIYIPTLIYLILIVIGSRLMKNRPAINPGKYLTYWNSFLAIFSLFGTIRLTQDSILNYQWTNGIVESICSRTIVSTSSVWFALFALSKLIEFGDTFFLIIKKRPIIFLHWYHHISVYILVLHLWSTFSPLCRYFAAVNYAVHTIMYTYYAITSTGIKVPRVISMSITSIQLSQMFIGLIITIIYYFNCDDKIGGHSSTYLALIIYGSYAGLFANYLIKTYFGIGAKKSRSRNRSFREYDGRAFVVNGFKDK